MSTKLNFELDISWFLHKDTSTVAWKVFESMEHIEIIKLYIRFHVIELQNKQLYTIIEVCGWIMSCVRALSYINF